MFYVARGNGSNRLQVPQRVLKSVLADTIFGAPLIISNTADTHVVR